MTKYFWFLFFFLVFCKNKKTEECIDRGINIEYLTDIDKLIKDGYKCETTFNDFNIDELKKCKVLFSDSKYKIIYNGYKSRLLIDKKENITIAINSRTIDFKTIKDLPFAVFLLNDKLMPIYAISKLGEEKTFVYKIEYLNEKIILSKAINKEVAEIDVNKLKYSQIKEIFKKSIYRFRYKKEKLTLDSYFYNVPFWTEGLN